MNNTSIKTKDLTKVAIMGSLVCVATYLFKIPTIAGFTHLGDCMIFISVLILMQAAEDLGVPVFIHCGHPPYSLPWSIGLLAERFPNVKVIMIHMGHGHGVYIDGSLKMAMRYPNIYLEMSGMPMSIKIRQAYEQVGKDRIMFGIDAPFHHPTVEIQKVLTSELDKQGLEDVFYNNAAKLMNLK